jgi:hypothetical protein
MAQEILANSLDYMINVNNAVLGAFAENMSPQHLLPLSRIASIMVRHFHQQDRYID